MVTVVVQVVVVAFKKINMFKDRTRSGMNGI